MHFNTLSIATVMVAVLVQSGEANIGQGLGFIGRVAAEIGTGAWNVGVEVATKKTKRQSTSPYPGVSDEEYNRCYDEAAGTRIEVTSAAAGTIQFDNVPATCMNLANVLAGDGSGGPYALPCGSACLQYTGLSQDEFNQIASALQGVA